METETLFRAMADGTRRRVLGVLSRQELSVSELVDLLRLPQSTVSRHLKVLREAGMLLDRRQGATVLYSVPTPGEEDSHLGAQLLHWISEEPLAKGLANRLEDLVARRFEQGQGFFSRIAHRWDALREESFGSSFPWESFLSLLPEKWIVADLGAGTGFLLPALASHFDRVIAIDPVDSMLQLAARRVEAAGAANVTLKQGDLAGLPLDDQSVDLAVAMLVLHHVPEPLDAFQEIRRILRPGGRVLIVEQHVHDSQTFQDRMHDPRRGIEPEELRRWLESAGFDLIKQQKLATVQPGDDAPALHVSVARSNTTCGLNP